MKLIFVSHNARFLICREQEKRHKITTLKIIEKKYFKKPKEPNLLTWTAKEQLKYLNSMDPGLWTPEKLAESFPISVEGVKVNYDYMNVGGGHFI